MNINRIKGQIKSYGHKMELVLGRKPGIWDWAKFGVGGTGPLHIRVFNS